MIKKFAATGLALMMAASLAVVEIRTLRQQVVQQQKAKLKQKHRKQKAEKK